MYNKSRMMGDYQVRFCERLGLKRPCLLDLPPLCTIMDDNKPISFADEKIITYKNKKNYEKFFSNEIQKTTFYL